MYLTIVSPNFHVLCVFMSVPGIITRNLAICPLDHEVLDVLHGRLQLSSTEVSAVGWINGKLAVFGGSA